MKFWFVLQILGWRMRWLARNNERFRQQLKGRDVVMQWRTRSGKPSRWFQFTQGNVVAGGGLHENPTFSLNFLDAAYAFAVLKAASTNQSAFMDGLSEGNIKVEGSDPGQLMWFMTLLKYIAPTKK